MKERRYGHEDRHYGSEMIGPYRVPPTPLWGGRKTNRRSTAAAAGTIKVKAMLRRMDARKAQP